MDEKTDAKALVDSLFEGYEQTAALADFKEELLGNLNAKIDNFVKNGMDAQTAFAKASAELGDVSALANELSLKKRKEVFEEVYMDIKMYMTSRRVAGYVIFGVLALFGITVACITLFDAQAMGFNGHLNLTEFFGVLLPFITAATAGFTFLGMTQEMPSMYPVSKKRGAWYAVAASLIVFGLLLMPIVYFGSKFADDVLKDIFMFNVQAWVPVIAMMIPFVLPGAGLLTFLVLTEKDRLKPWAKDFHKKAVEREMAIWQDPTAAARFGMFSGAIWICAIGLFILLGFLIGFKFSWLVFIFAIAAQLLMQGLMSKPQKPATS